MAVWVPDRPVGQAKGARHVTEQDVFDSVVAAMAFLGAPEAYARWGNRTFSDINTETLRSDPIELGEAGHISTCSSQRHSLMAARCVEHALDDNR